MSGWEERRLKNPAGPGSKPTWAWLETTPLALAHRPLTKPSRLSSKSSGPPRVRGLLEFGHELPVLLVTAPALVELLRRGWTAENPPRQPPNPVGEKLNRGPIWAESTENESSGDTTEGNCGGCTSCSVLLAKQEILCHPTMPVVSGVTFPHQHVILPPAKNHPGS